MTTNNLLLYSITFLYTIHVIVEASFNDSRILLQAGFVALY